MNYYYIDPSASTNGTGTQDSPYNTWGVLGTLNPSFPFSILVKRGTVERGNFNYSTLRNLVSSSSESSVISSYGTGAWPTLIQDSGSDQVLHLALRNTVIAGINFCTNEVSQSSDLVGISAYPNTDGSDTNVFLTKCQFTSFPYTMISQYCKGLSLYANRDVNQPANKIGVTDSLFNYLSRGVQILGNYNVPSTQDPTTNVGDRYRSNGAVIDSCSFTNMRDDGAILNRCTSPDSAGTDTTNAMVSKISNCTYSSFRTNTAASDNYTQAASVAFWMVYSNKCIIEYCTVSGSYAARMDRMAFDFDIMTWDCVIRYCYSHNNAGGIVLFISNADGDGSESQPSGTSNTEWFVNRRWGQGNNVIHDCISFNDGVTRSAAASGLWMSKVRLFGYASNCEMRNVTVIDTLSSSRHCYIQQYPKFTSSDNVTSLEFNAVNFKFRYLTNTDIIRGDTDTSVQGLIKFTGCNLFSDALGENGFSIPSYADGGSNTQVDPKFEFIPKSSPSSFDSAKLIKMMASSTVTAGYSS